MTPAEPTPRSPWQVASQVSYLGIFFGMAILIGYGGGRWIENRWGGRPYVSLCGVLIGIISGFRELYRVGKKYKG